MKRVKNGLYTIQNQPRKKTEIYMPEREERKDASPGGWELESSEFMELDKHSPIGESFSNRLVELDVKTSALPG